MEIIVDILLFCTFCVILSKVSGFFVRSTLKIGKALKLTEFVIGFIVIAISTSVPELLVGISSAIQGIPELSLGNVIGSNIFNLTLVIGIVILIHKGVRVESKTVRRNTYYMFGITLLPLILFIDHRIDFIDSIILLVAFSLYIRHILKEKKVFRERLNHVSHSKFFEQFILSIIALFLIVLSARVLVVYAEKISIALNLPGLLVGLFMVSLGTSLPEITIETKAILSEHKYLALGDLIGSVVTNSTLVIAVTALIVPITADFLLVLTSSVFLIAVSFLFMTFCESEKKLSWQEGIALILFYVLFVIVEFSIRTIQMR